jgi:NAD(P)-dependent dehydrogenase (short-subunit alcohol dehydrogenase family)
MPTVLVVGASRGIGLEFVRQYAGEGARVIATHRAPDDAAPLRALGARPVALDVCDPEGIAALGWQVESETIDVALLVAGVYGPRTADLTPPSSEAFDAVMHTNVLAAMQLIPIVSSSVVKAKGKLVALSSRMGSIGTMTGSSGWLYRASKAALNSVMKAASNELGAQGVVCMSMHPGWVRTQMGGTDADLAVADAVQKMRRVIAAANRSHNGKFLNFSGEQIEW